MEEVNQGIFLADIDQYFLKNANLYLILILMRI